MQLGDKLRVLRQNKDEFQEDIANLFKVQKSSVSNWETNKARPPYEILLLYADHYGVTTDYLLGHNAEDANKMEMLKMAMIEAGIDTKEGLEKAMQILEVFRNEKK